MLYKIVKAVVGGLFKLIYRFEIINKEKINNDKKLIICSNHVSNLDPIIISAVFKKQVYWMAKKELFDIKPLGWFLDKLGAFPVDRETTSLSTLRTSMKILKDEHSLGIFPEGTRVKNIDLKNAKPGVALISIKSKAPILPVYIESTFKPFSKIKVVIGDELEFYNTDDKIGKDDYKLLGEEVLKQIYELGN